MSLGDSFPVSFLPWSIQVEGFDGRGQLTPAGATVVCEHLKTAADGLRTRITPDWTEVLCRYHSSLVDHLDEFATQCRIHPKTLAASWEELFGGLRDSVDHLNTLRNDKEPAEDVTLVVLASNIPGLAAQSLPVLLASGSAVLCRPSRREPWSAPLLAQILGEVDANWANAVAVCPWDHAAGNADSVTAAVRNGLDRVVAYGDDESVEAIGRGYDRVSQQGSGWSVVYLDERDIRPDTLALIARDTALFEQRGCLSPSVVVSNAPASGLVEMLGSALAEAAETWPAETHLSTLAMLRQMRDEAVASGRAVSSTPLDTGLVVESTTQEVSPGPGGRCLAVYGDRSLAELEALLQPFAGQIQSLATAPSSLVQIEVIAQRVGIRHAAETGRLHRAGFDWVAQQLN